MVTRSPKLRVKFGILAAVAMWFASGVGAVPAAGSDLARQTAIIERTTYGLPVDDLTLRALEAPGVDVGTKKYGFPLTAAEDERLDLNGRIRFANDMSQTVMPFVRELPAYGGAYIDQLSDGSLVVMLTDVAPSTVAAIQAKAPRGSSRGVRIVKAEHTEKALVEAIGRTWGVWADVRPDVPVLSVGVDTIRNRLAIEVEASDLAAADGAAPAVATRLGVPVAVQVGEPDQDVVCTTRDNCHTPLKAGIRVRANGAANAPCSMGFHIRLGTDEQWMTAGHCGCLYQSQAWHHVGLGLVGNEIAGGSLISLPDDKIDAMRVQMNDAQASALMYGDTQWMEPASQPIVSETVYAQMAQSNVKKTGTVAQIDAEWGSNFCGVDVVGGDTTMTAIGGDSGSPIYRRFFVANEGWFMVPIGINDTAGGRFAIVADALDHWDATIVNP